jgi:putative nucleotidyltransferase with HDIG domain
MFEAFRRAQLTKEGLSCGRTRRKHQDDDFCDALRCHPAFTGALLTAFVVAVLLLLHVAAGIHGAVMLPGITDGLYATALSLVAVTHLYICHRDLLRDNRTLLLVLGTLILHLATMLAVLKFGLVRGWTGPLLVFALPHAIAPLVLSIMLGRKVGIFAATYSSVIGAIVCLPADRLTYLAGSAFVGFLAVLVTHRVRRRQKLFIAGCYAGLGAAGLCALLSLVQFSGQDFSLSQSAYLPLLTGVLTGMAVGGVLPIMEIIFGVTTDVSWLELADLNHPLMRRLSIEAPGTYHHSLVLANLAEAAAESIGASAVMSRVCCYFHDIGKLNKPEYFIENMDPSENPHGELTARMSALVLIAHVKDGVDLALKHNLNNRIVDVIEQHHGTSLAYYFYRRALDQKAEFLRLVEQEKASCDDIPQISEDVFRYPGPKPQFRESAIISLADAVESASRTLEKPTAARLEQLITEIVQMRMLDGQLDECDLTLSELAKVKASFVKTLASMMHNRIKYQSRESYPRQHRDTMALPSSQMVALEATATDGAHSPSPDLGAPGADSPRSRSGRKRSNKDSSAA